jgi:hypothetical protein
MNRNVSRALYIGFVLLGLFYLARPGGERYEAISALGIALAFDPFDPSIPLPKRPAFQRGMLYVHLATVLALVGRQVLAMTALL